MVARMRRLPTELAATAVVLDRGARDLVQVTLESCAAQTLGAFEVVLVSCSDGVDVGGATLWSGSAAPDGLAVRWVGGSGELRDMVNLGVNSARGDVVLVLEAGDEIRPTELEESVWSLATRARFDARLVYAVASGDERSAKMNAPHRLAFRRSAWRPGGGHASLPRDGSLESVVRAGLSGTHTKPSVLGESGAGAYRDGSRPVSRLRAKFANQVVPGFREWLDHPMESLHIVLPVGTVAGAARVLGLSQCADALSVLPPVHPSPESLLDFGEVHSRSSRAPISVLVLHSRLALGGADRVLLDIVSRADAQALSLGILTHSEGRGEWRDRFAHAADDVFEMSQFLESRDWPGFVLSYVESRGVDVVLLSNSDYGYRLCPEIKSRFPTVPIIDLLHAETPYQQFDNFRTAARYRRYLDHRVVTTERVASALTGRYGESRDRVSVIPNGVDTQREFNPGLVGRRDARARLGLEPDGSVVGFIGRFAPEKQPVDILRVAALMRDRPRTRFALFGSGELEMLLRRTVASLGLENVTINGPAKDAADVIAAADVMFFPSKREGLPIAGLEAMSMRRPIVASNVAGWKDLLKDEETGVLIEDGDIQGYAAAISALLEDESRASRIATAARARAVGYYDTGRMVAQWEALLISLARRGSGGAPR